MFSDDLTYPDDFLSFDNGDFDITFDDIQLPSDTKDFFNSTFNPTNPIDMSSSDPEFNALMMYVPLTVDYLTNLPAKINCISGGIDGRPWVALSSSSSRPVIDYFVRMAIVINIDLNISDNDEYKGKGEGEGCYELEEKYENQNNQLMKAKRNRR
ncbi:hypothetical protein L1887_39422 [Cichorium endivia]|nr:hypothetical protein L1887_39422 [Cichorium endivia]